MPGSLFSLFGTDLASSQALATTLPLPTSLADTTVTINGYAAPLLYVSPTQVNLQVPWEVSGGTANIVVSRGLLQGQQTQEKVVTNDAAPFMIDYAAKTAAARFAYGPLLGQVMTKQLPAKAGDYLSVYCTGLGPVSNPPKNGYSALADPLSSFLAPLTAFVDGVEAPVLWAGLAPNFVGLYQVNLQVPVTPHTGTVPLTLVIGGVTASTATLEVSK